MVQNVENNRSMSSNDNGGGYQRSDHHHHHLSNHFQSFEVNQSKRIRLSPELNQQKGEVDGRQQSRRLLGLRLTRTPSFMNQIDEMELAQERQKSGSIEKMKASNFPATVLKVGHWERVSKHEGNLVAKWYFAKRKLVWEILDGALKSKIEIQWSEIAAIRAIILDNEPGMLEIELNQPPLFYRESNPEPRKHTIWQQSYDFTGGQASTWRRHYVRFAPGILDNHYEKLLQCDSRLYKLSQKPFPCQVSPYFEPESYGFSQFSFGQNRPTYLHELQHSHHRNHPKPLISNHVQNMRLATQFCERAMSSDSPISVMNFTRRNEIASNNDFQHNRISMVQGNSWDNYLQGPIYSYGNTQSVCTPNTRVPNEMENHHLNNVEDTRAIKHIKNHLLGDADDNILITNAQSVFPSLDQSSEDVESQLQYRPSINGSGDEILGVELSCPQPINGLLPQSSMMEPQVGSNCSLVPSYALLDGDFSMFDHTQNDHNWE